MRHVKLGLVFMVLLWGSFVNATSYQQLSLDEILSKAELAFYGKVTATQAVEKDGEIWTQVSFELLNKLKGFDEETSTRELFFYGGELNGKLTQVSLMPQFAVGESLIILAYNAEYYSPIVGFKQGLWREREVGFLNEAGNLLSLNEDSELVIDGLGGLTDDILGALKEKLEAPE